MELPILKVTFWGGSKTEHQGVWRVSRKGANEERTRRPWPLPSMSNGPPNHCKSTEPLLLLTKSYSSRTDSPESFCLETFPKPRAEAVPSSLKAQGSAHTTITLCSEHGLRGVESLLCLYTVSLHLGVPACSPKSPPVNICLLRHLVLLQQFPWGTA